ncbi:hypothetical protein OHT57_42575 [Streptomyces sp. NBC_00285]|uniref:hypothetical protein n=1 Tax=Streptomyces sp. NBC_00285 TaxID=2975700 RepID=UPI002E28AC4C|nr:hypothetical protein [Streptomyces sp. NBC_00285]
MIVSAVDTARDLARPPVLSHGSGTSFALDRVVLAGGTLDRNAAHAGPLLRKDVRLLTDVAAAAGASPGTVTAAAQEALALMDAATGSRRS